MPSRWKSMLAGSMLRGRVALVPGFAVVWIGCGGTSTPTVDPEPVAARAETVVQSAPEAEAIPSLDRALGLEPMADTGVAAADLSFPLDNPGEVEADREALQALRTLEYRSLDRKADHVRGTMPVPDAAQFPIEPGAAVERSEPAGGTASAVGAAELAIEAFADHGRVQYYVDFFVGPSSDRFHIWLERLPRFEGMIREALDRYGVPQDMIYLALIESGYSSTAISRARAVGMWQFVRRTGRAYGLRIDSWVDERRDPIKATDAAARHLRDLKERFGSWYLAAAAYNAGETRVTRGLERLRVDEPSDETFFDLADRRYIRRETRDYVPKLIAATMVARDPEGHGFRGVEPYAPFVFDEVTVPDQTGLDVIADLAETTTSIIRELNPHYYRGATPPREISTVRVPEGTGVMVTQRYAVLPNRERLRWLEHRIQRGETLSEIAEQYRVGLSALRAANPNLSPRRLRIGARVVIPLGGTPRTRRSTPVQRVAAPGTGLHVVRTGDTLYQIAQMYGVGISDLRAWNGMGAAETLLRVGQRLRVVEN